MSTAIKGRFGQWLLVELNTGRWCAVWHAFEGTEAFQAILDENQRWFDCQVGFARPKVQGTKILALNAIKKSLEKERGEERARGTVHNNCKYFDDELLSVEAAMECA